MTRLEASKRYIKLCKKYKEEPQYVRDVWGVLMLDCYGRHAQALLDQEEKAGQA